MTPSVPRRFIVSRLVLPFALVAAAACQSDRPVSPTVEEPNFAKGGPSANPTVTSTMPAQAPRNITLNVTVAGSGFEQGSRAVWAIAGDTTFAHTKVKTNSTTYVSPKQLVASISIAADAPVDVYDVQVVTLSGRKGIGIELFAVTALIDLGPASDSAQSEAFAINNTGVAVGWTNDSLYHLGQVNATRWSQAGSTWTATDLTSLLGSPVSGAYGLNDGGDIVGTMRVPSGAFHAFVLSAAGVVIDLGSLPGLSESIAYDINTAGEVVGYAYRPSTGDNRPFYWSPSAGLVALPTLGGDNVAEAHAVNDNGTIVGMSWDPAVSAYQAVRWQRVGGVWTIGRLPSGIAGSGKAINNNEDIVGVACVGPAPCQQHAMLWPAGGGLVDIGTLGGTTSEANGVNNAGLVVGTARNKLGYDRAFSWTLAAGMKDLGALGGDRTVGTAQAVNDLGLIAGISIAATTAHIAGQFHGTLWRGP